MAISSIIRRLPSSEEDRAISHLVNHVGHCELCRGPVHVSEQRRALGSEKCRKRARNVSDLFYYHDGEIWSRTLNEIGQHQLIVLINHTREIVRDLLRAITYGLDIGRNEQNLSRTPLLIDYSDTDRASGPRLLPDTSHQPDKDLALRVLAPSTMDLQLPEREHYERWLPSWRAVNNGEIRKRQLSPILDLDYFNSNDQPQATHCYYIEDFHDRHHSHPPSTYVYQDTSSPAIRHLPSVPLSRDPTPPASRRPTTPSPPPLRPITRSGSPRTMAMPVTMDDEDYIYYSSIFQPPRSRAASVAPQLATARSHPQATTRGRGVYDERLHSHPHLHSHPRLPPWELGRRYLDLDEEVD